MKGTRALTIEGNSIRNLEAIETFLCADEEERLQLELTPKQQEFMNRWNFADNLLCTGRYDHGEVARQLAVKFGVSVQSAQDDIRNAQIVFGSSNALNKRYTAYAQIRRLEKNIRLCVAAQKWKEAGDFEKTLQRAIANLPEAQAPKSARTIVFNIQNNNQFEVTEDALASAMQVAGEYIESEEVEDE
jgi:hypothetical protein